MKAKYPGKFILEIGNITKEYVRGFYQGVFIVIILLAIQRLLSG